MTIIEPNKNRRRVDILFWGSIALLLGVALWSISVYNQTVNLSHELRLSEDRERTLEAENAELKNERYSLINSKQLHAIASAHGLVKATRPEYLEIAPGNALANR